MEAETRYARSGDVHIAYRVFGNGPRDIILVPGTVSHVELYWELPVNEYLLRRLTSFARVIVFDKRGQGLSDRVAEPDAGRAGRRRAGGDGCGRVEARDDLRLVRRRPDVSLMFAATHPERVSGLVLYGAYASIKIAAVGRESRELFD